MERMRKKWISSQKKIIIKKKIKTSSLKNANTCQAPILSDHDQTDQTKLTEATRSALVQFVIYLYPVWFAQKLKPQAD